MEHPIGDDADFALPPEFDDALRSDSAPIRVSGPEPEAEASEGPEVTEFSEEDRATFSSLLTVGTRVRAVSVMGHSVLMATPNVDDELRVALFTKEYRETEGFVRAFQAAVVAASIREINGEPFYAPLTSTPDPAELFAKRVEKVRKMYPLVVSTLFQRVIEMEQEYAQMAAKLGKL